MSKIKTEQPAVDDEHAGKGGSYVVENGRRVLVSRTQSRDEAQAVKQEVNDVVVDS